jgi:anaerobic magnesium-protoporphyrin IX monomethyl ester cyclase
MRCRQDPLILNVLGNERNMSSTSPRILLIYPSSRTQSHHSCPMGILMLGAVLEKAGYPVRLLDANAVCNRRSSAEIVKEVEDYRPSVVGITLLTPLAKEAYRLAGCLRGCGAKLIAGGPHATLLPEEPLAHGFDAVVAGEGEPTIVEAVEAVLGNIPLDSVKGLFYRTPEGEIHANEPRSPIADLDSLPLPARHLAPAADFGPTAAEDLHAAIFTSRGCSGRCAYCSGGLFGKKFRFRSADSVVDELIAIHREFGTRHFYFMDDAMSIDRERMRRICGRMIDEQLGFTWNMMTRIDAVDEELLALAARAGCKQIEYGVESGCAETLKKIHKPHTVEMVRRMIPLTKRYGIRPVAFFILGFPWENAASFAQTRQLMEELSPHVLFQPAIASILIPFPGTEIFERYKAEFGFDQWWLSDDRNFDAPSIDRHAYYQVVMHRMGVVLDADFFRYSPQVKQSIHEVFRFMFASNFRQRSAFVRHALLLAIDISRKLARFSPKLERAIFKAPLMLRQSLLRKRGYA